MQVIVSRQQGHHQHRGGLCRLVDRDTTHLQELNVPLSTLTFLLKSTSTVNGSITQGKDEPHTGIRISSAALLCGACVYLCSCNGVDHRCEYHT